MSEEVRVFFAARREAWLKSPDQRKKIKNGVSEEELEQEADEKFHPAEWCAENARRAKSLSLVTHNPKFSHPDIKIKDVNVIQVTAQQKDDGYLRTGNCEYKSDAYGDAASLAVLKFLQLEMTDGRTVLEHFERSSEELRKEIGVSAGQFAEMREQFLNITMPKSKDTTSDLLKQVYFPVGDDYHLLSLITPGGLISVLKQRIDDVRFGNGVNEARDQKRNGKFSECGYADIPNLAVIGYGGTKAQNIGQLNLGNGGKATMLMTLPPALQDRKVYPPRTNFFRNCLRVNTVEEFFDSLDHLRAIDYNNASIRSAIEHWYKKIIDQIVAQAWAIRRECTGWSYDERYSAVPLYQKLWLDEARQSERDLSEDWQQSVIENMVQWIRMTYEKRKNMKGPKFDSTEIQFMTRLASESKEGLV
ncbi:type I-F CRISPR-associated protein Csy1 [Spirochaeta africana]|uniref:CRISPR type I-F/YPEST-associated protein Csy1 n=1 Tax=Spirochaeta africana (strain ATCC 700263 / DSM 8902 / Z-7692) TaxID=889378 RepID=H9UG67_SPIAZ|nr:type I-F CRISPR-associated protein Csy1 [Spirochaeta africana]AFG36510.1 CRISPR type I-F/YPEST-associated protein Csy1 [Spirochaeta africana DSM 8902]